MRCWNGNVKSFIKKRKTRTLFIVSGDMSHKLEGSDYGFSPRGEIFDKDIIDILTNHPWQDKTDALVELDNKFKYTEVVDCIRGPLLVLMGIFGKEEYKFKLLSYENPAGTGVLVGKFE